MRRRFGGFRICRNVLHLGIAFVPGVDLLLDPVVAAASEKRGVILVRGEGPVRGPVVTDVLKTTEKASASL
jgi:hypothetical protein